MEFHIVQKSWLWNSCLQMKILFLAGQLNGKQIWKVPWIWMQIYHIIYTEPNNAGKRLQP